MHKERQKQARKILKKLAVKGAYIVCDLSAIKREEALPCRLYTPFSGKDSKQEKKAVLKMSFEADVLKELLSLEWIIALNQSKPANDLTEASKERTCYHLSKVGKSTLRRLLAGGNDFTAQHQIRKGEQRTEDGRQYGVTYVEKDSPLAWLARRKDRLGQPMISAEALQAGQRLAQDFYFAGLEANVTANWSLAGGSSGSARKHGAKGGGQTADHILEAKDRIRKVTAFLGNDMATILLDVCCYHQGLEQLEKSRHWPKRSGKIVLQLGLQRLAEYYGLLTPENQRHDYRPLSSWGAEGYRPKIRPD